MNKRKLTLIFTFTLAIAGLFPGTGWAGPSTSGGGTAVVCRNPDGQIYFSELLDLYEANLSLIPVSGSIFTDYHRAVANTYRLQGFPDLAQERRSEIAENLRKFFDIVQMTKPGERLPRLDDVGALPHITENCGLEQLAIFSDAKPTSVRLDAEIWGTLNSRSQAALVMHELFYHYERTMKETTSESTRSMVAHVFAAEGAVQPDKEGVPADALQCQSLDLSTRKETGRDAHGVGYTYDRLSSFYAFPVLTPEGPGVRLQFKSFGSRPAIVRTVLDVPGMGLELEKHILNFKGLPEQVMVVTAPNKSLTVEVPFRTGIYRGWTAEITYRTGQPLRLQLKRRGVVMSDEYVSSCSQ